MSLYPVCCYSLVQWLASEPFHTHVRKHFVLKDYACLMFAFHVSFYTVAVKSPFALVSVSSLFQFEFLSKITRHSFLIWLVVPSCLWSEYINHQISQEKKLSIYSLCCKFSFLVVSSCLCLNTLTCCVFIPSSHIACRFLSKIICASVVYAAWKPFKAQWLHQ